MTDPFTLNTEVGKLIEARVFELKTIGNADEYSLALAKRVERFVADERPVLCADHRPVVIYPQDVADRLTDLFTHMNARLERVAILVARSNATLSLQLNRIVREAGYENRRVFFDTKEAVEWLAPALDPAERVRVERFLAGFSS